MRRIFPKRSRRAVLWDWLITFGLFLLSCVLSSLLMMADPVGGTDEMFAN